MIGARAAVGLVCLVLLALFFRSLQLEGVFPDSKTVTGISFATPTPSGQPT
jgi:hypothetical protein